MDEVLIGLKWMLELSNYLLGLTLSKFRLSKPKLSQFSEPGRWHAKQIVHASRFNFPIDERNRVWNAARETEQVYYFETELPELRDESIVTGSLSIPSGPLRLAPSVAQPGGSVYVCPQLHTGISEYDWLVVNLIFSEFCISWTKQKSSLRLLRRRFWAPRGGGNGVETYNKRGDWGGGPAPQGAVEKEKQR